jgi:curved DNA-binding protein CbpA
MLQVAEMLDFYAVLGLPRRANHEEIKAAYWSLAKQSHPDVNAGDQAAEQRTKDINRAYETLGDPDARAAYDLELQRRRTRARRSFWTSAATGAMTCILTVGCFGLMMWRQHAERQQLSSSKGSSSIVASSTGSARNEDLQARLPADHRPGAPTAELANAKRSHVASDDVVDAPSKPVIMARHEGRLKKPRLKDRASVPTAELASAGGGRPPNDDVVDTPSEPVNSAGIDDVAKAPELADAKGSHAPGEAMSPPPPKPIGEPPRSANVEVASAVPRKGEAEAPKGALPPSIVRDGSPNADLQNELSGTVQVPEGEGRRVPPAPAGDASPASEHGNGSEPEVGPRPPMAVATVDPPSDGTLVPHEQPSTAPSGTQRTKKYLYKTAIGRTPVPGKAQASEQASRLVAKNAMALRFPSADEPYVNVGARER